MLIIHIYQLTKKVCSDMNVNQIDLTATELGYLWSTYQAETLNHCILTYFDKIVEDPEIKQLNSSTLETCKNNISQIQNIFENF